jgi:PST family polysaccharide transporter
LAEALSFGSAVILARIISPAEFGHAALALVLVALAYALTNEFFAGALIQWKSVRRADWETSLLLSLTMAVCLAGLVLLIREPVLEPLFGERTADLFLLATPVFFLAALELVPRAMLARRLDFRATSILNVVGDFTRAVSAVLLATLAGLDGEALVLAAVLAPVTGAVGGMILVRPPRPRFDRRSARALVKFGAPTAGSSVIWTAEQNADYLILGARTTPADVGFYWRAYGLGVQYQAKITSVMTGMAFPVYSRTSGLEHMRALRMRVLRVHSVVIVPLVTLLIVVAPDLVPWLFGEEWEPAVEPTQLLALGGIFAALSAGTGPVVLAAGKPKPLLLWNIGKLTGIAVVVFFTAPEGIVAVAAGVAGYRALECLASYELLLRRLVGIELKQLWADASAGIVSSLPLLGVAFGVSELASDADVPTLALLLLVTGAGGLAYLVTLRLAFRDAWADLALLARRVFGRASEA